MEISKEMELVLGNQCEEEPTEEREEIPLPFASKKQKKGKRL